MVVCKFFQQGNCRYGQNCRFDHIYGSKYSYHANPAAEVAQAGPVITDESLVNQVQSYVQSIIQGGQWLLSVYAPFKDKPAFPGFVDMSPEEARLLIYEAKANNNLDQAGSNQSDSETARQTTQVRRAGHYQWQAIALDRKARKTRGEAFAQQWDSGAKNKQINKCCPVMFMNNLFQEAKRKHELLLTKNSNITKVLQSLNNGKNVPDPFGSNLQSNAAFGNNASSVFRSAVQPTPASVFSQNTASVFAQNNSFAQDPAKSIFAQATQNVFQTNQTPSMFSQNVQNPSTQNIFAQPDTAQSLFAQATQNAFTQNTPANIFKTQNENSTQMAYASASQTLPSHQSPFSQSYNTPANVFQKPVNQSVFGTQNAFQPVVDAGVYSKMEDLSPEDLDAFKSDDFKMGFIPEIPPPQSLCI